MENNNQKIQTIILCGGMGTRLREETEFKPKPMVEIGDKPILWHIMKIYSYYGYQNFVLALGYKGNQIKDYFLKQKYYFSDFSLNLVEGKVSNFFKNGQEDNFNIIFGETGIETPHGERILKLKTRPMKSFILLFALSTSLFACTASRHATPSSQWSIAYNVLVDSEKDDYDVFVMNADGSQKQNSRLDW